MLRSLFRLDPLEKEPAPPLGVKLNIYGELLAKRHKDKLDGEALEFLQFLQAASSRMASLVGDLRAYTQVAKLDVLVDVTDAHAVLESVVSDLTGAISESGASLSDHQLPSVRVHILI